MSLTDLLLEHTASVTGVPVGELRAAASPIGDDLDAVSTLLTLAQVTHEAGEIDTAGAVLDDAIQKLVTARHNLAPGGRVRRYLPELREGLVLMDDGQRWRQQEWRRSERYPDRYVDQDGALCDARSLPASLIVVPAYAERES